MNILEHPASQAAAGATVVSSWAILPPILAATASALAIIYYTILIYKNLRNTK